MDKKSRLEEYQKELEKDVELNIQNIKDKGLMISSIRAKWIRYFYKEKEFLDKLKYAKNTHSRKLANNINKQAKSKFPTLNINEDPQLLKINSAIKQTEYCIDFIDKAFNIFETFNFQIKNVIDLIKLEVF